MSYSLNTVLDFGDVYPIFQTPSTNSGPNNPVLVSEDHMND